MTWYNHRHMRLAEQADLRGASSGTVEAVLGRPTAISEYWSVYDLEKVPKADAHRLVTYNYAPHPLLPFAKFQVHFRDDRVTGLEMFDD